MKGIQKGVVMWTVEASWGASKMVKKKILSFEKAFTIRVKSDFQF